MIPSKWLCTRRRLDGVGMYAEVQLAFSSYGLQTELACEEGSVMNALELNRTLMRLLFGLAKLFLHLLLLVAGLLLIVRSVLLVIGLQSVPIGMRSAVVAPRHVGEQVKDVSRHWFQPQRDASRVVVLQVLLFDKVKRFTEQLNKHQAEMIQ